MAMQRGTITCSSNNGSYRYCPVDTSNRVRLIRQISGSPCDYGRTWGYDYRGIWVDRGCRAEFEFGRDSGGGGRTAAIAAGVIGAGVLAAVLATRSRNRDNDYDQMNSDQRLAYDRGYELGQDDKQAGRTRQYTRYKYEYDSAYETYFRKGYEQGYDDVSGDYSSAGSGDYDYSGGS